MNRPLTSLNTPENDRNSKTLFSKSCDRSKNLWTPCRRLGLSRKIKATPSPNQSKTQTPVEEAKCTPITHPTLEVSPMREEKKSNKQEEQHTETPTAIKKGKKPDKPKRISSANSRKNIQARFEAENSVTSKRSPELSLANCKVILDVINVPDKVKSSKPKSKKPLCKKTDLNTLNEDSCHNHTPALEQTKCESPPILTPDENIVNSLETSEVVFKTNSTASVSKPTKRLSIKKSFSSQDDLSDDDLPVMERFDSPVLQEIGKESSSDLKIVEDVEEVTSPLRSTHKKRRIILSSDEEDFVASQNSAKQGNADTKEPEEDWSKKVAEIKARIKKKESRLAELKQAAIYKKLHNLEEIDRLTLKWQAACENGLQRLLQSIKSHGDIDMLTLLRNLKLEKCIDYDVNTGCFIYK